MARVVPVILAGGQGRRLWPLSSKARPKQFLKLTDTRYSLLQCTAKRAMLLAKAEEVITVAHAGHASLLEGEYSAVDKKLLHHVLYEPCSRNTASAVAMAAMYAKETFGEDTLLWVMPSDHSIRDEESLRTTVLQAVENVRQDEVFLFGIKPKHANPDFGYIIPVEPGNDVAVRKVDRFVEKPRDIRIINDLLAQGAMYNSGMFVVHASTVLDSLSSYDSVAFLQMHQAFSNRDLNQKKHVYFVSSTYQALPDISLDKAMIESHSNLNMLSLSAGWNDVGTWFKLWELSEEEAELYKHGRLRGFIRKVANAA